MESFVVGCYEIILFLVRLTLLILEAVSLSAYCHPFEQGDRKLTGDETLYRPPGYARLFLHAEKNSMCLLSAKSKPV